MTSKIDKLIQTTETLIAQTDDPLQRKVLQDWVRYEVEVASSLMRVENTVKDLLRTGITAQVRALLEALEPFARVGNSLQTTYGADADELLSCSFPASAYLQAAELWNKYQSSPKDNKEAIVSISLGNPES